MATLCLTASATRPDVTPTLFASFKEPSDKLNSLQVTKCLVFFRQHNRFIAPFVGPHLLLGLYEKAMLRTK